MKTPACVVAGALLGLMSCGGDRSEPAIDGFQLDAPRDTVLPNGEASLFVRRVGRGDPVLVIHGGPGMEHTYLLPGLEVLAADHELILYDQRGTGRSDAPLDESSISLDAFLSDIERIRTGLGYERVHVLAHSAGGFLGMQYAIRHPDRVRSLVLMSTVEPGARFAAEAQERIQAARSPADMAISDSIVASDAFQRGEPAAVNAIYRTAFAGTLADRADTLLLEIDFNDRTARNGSTVTRLLMTPFIGVDFYDRLSSITAPVLLLGGADDPTPPGVNHAIAEAIGGARVVMLDGVGHFPYLEAPEATRLAITRFWAETP